MCRIYSYYYLYKQENWDRAKHTFERRMHDMNNAFLKQHYILKTEEISIERNLNELEIFPKNSNKTSRQKQDLGQESNIITLVLPTSNS